MRKIALVSNTDFSIYNFRMGLIQALLAKGYKVHIVCPDGEYSQKLVKQLIDLALLANNQLRGEDLAAFVKRSVDLIK